MSAPHGYPANPTYASPLCHVPFDINQPHFVPGTMVVNARSKVREQNQLDALRMDAQGQFYETESEAWVGYLFYLSSIFMRSRSIPRCLKYDNYDLSRQPFAGRSWSHLDAVKHYKGKEVSLIQDIKRIQYLICCDVFFRQRKSQKMAVPHLHLHANPNPKAYLTSLIAPNQRIKGDHTGFRVQSF